MNSLSVNTKHKDRLFNFIFGREENKEWTLSLYNAVNHSDYKDASQIEFTTLENVIYVSMNNDTSFIIMDDLNIYEHQSTYNPNMPLRQLDYASRSFSSYVKKHKLNLYGSKLVELPTPKLVVFYNGVEKRDEETILQLSDSFKVETRSEADIEVRVRMININYGHNASLMKVCKPLEEYAWFIDEIRNNQDSGLDIASSTDLAIKTMPNDYVIKDFLVKHKAEVDGMLRTEYDEDYFRSLFMEDGRAEERINTERERQRADAAEAENEKLRARIKELEANQNN